MEKTGATAAVQPALASPPRDRRAQPRPADGLPWPSLLVLGGGTLLMVTAEMLPTAVLEQMSTGLGVAESSTGLLVSIWAAVVVVLSFPLVRLTRGRDRRAVITGGLVVLGVSSALTALAPTFELAVGARVLGASAVGLLWATTNAHVADLVPDRLLGRAVAVVLGGATLGMVVGTPFARLVADAAGWRASFWALAVLGLLGAVAVRLVVARAPRPVTAQSTAQSTAQNTVPGAEAPATAPRRGTGHLLAVTALVGLVLVGHYGAYTYITRLTEVPAEALPGGMSALLLVFGIASAAGVALAGRLGDRSGPALVVSVAGTALAVLALAVVDVSPVVGIGVVVVWGVVSGGMPPFAQTLILRIAGPERRSFAGALIPVLFNGGIAVGAALASMVVAGPGVAGVPPLAAGVVGAAALGLAVTLRGRRASTA
ncbi:MFS transporter [Promicromonospora xylanilytica]